MVWRRLGLATVLGGSLIGCRGPEPEPIGTREAPPAEDSARSPDEPPPEYRPSLVFSSPPTIPTTVPDDGFVEVAVANGHACARRADGRVSCWGSNLSGQLGDGTHDDSDGLVAVAGITDAVDLALGVAFSCALRRDGSVWCWGRNALGSLGTGDLFDRRLPTRVIGIDDAVALSSGNDSSQVCARRRSGEFWCWGPGHAIDGADEREWSRPRRLEISGLVEVATGSLRACGLREDGAVLCWGRTAERIDAWPPVVVDEVVGAVGLSLGAQLSLAWSGSGRLWAWGPEWVVESTKAIASLEDRDLSKATATDRLVCAIPGDDTQPHGLWCWVVHQDTPQELTLASAPVSIAGHGGEVCATDAEGRLSCWTASSKGEFGRPRSIESAKAAPAKRASSFPLQCRVRVRPAKTELLANVEAVSRVLGHSVDSPESAVQGLCHSMKLAVGSADCPTAGPWLGREEFRAHLFIPQADGTVLQILDVASFNPGNEEATWVEVHELRSTAPPELYVREVWGERECETDAPVNYEYCGMAETHRVHRIVTQDARGRWLTIEIPRMRKQAPIDAPLLVRRADGLALRACGVEAPL